MNCGRCFKRCSAIEVKAFGQCGRCQAKDTLTYLIGDEE